MRSTARGALGSARLQKVKLVVLDGEFYVLHVGRLAPEPLRTIMQAAAYLASNNKYETGLLDLAIFCLVANQ
jgi:hypothetical protein